MKLACLCSKLLIAACRWIIMTSVQAVPVHTLGYRPCSLFLPMYWESSSNAPRHPETAVAPARAGVIHREEVSRARALAPPAEPGTPACLRHRHPRHAYRPALRRRAGRGCAAPDGPGRHPGDPASGPGGAARGESGWVAPGGDSAGRATALMRGSQKGCVRTESPPCG
jgi:hypothetical protein